MFSLAGLALIWCAQPGMFNLPVQLSCMRLVGMFSVTGLCRVCHAQPGGLLSLTEATYWHVQHGRSTDLVCSTWCVQPACSPIVRLCSSLIRRAGRKQLCSVTCSAHHVQILVHCPLSSCFPLFFPCRVSSARGSARCCLLYTSRRKAEQPCIDLPGLDFGSLLCLFRHAQHGALEFPIHEEVEIALTVDFALDLGCGSAH